MLSASSDHAHEGPSDLLGMPETFSDHQHRDEGRPISHHEQAESGEAVRDGTPDANSDDDRLSTMFPVRPHRDSLDLPELARHPYDSSSGVVKLEVADCEDTSRTCADLRSKTASEGRARKASEADMSDVLPTLQEEFNRPWASSSLGISEPFLEGYEPDTVSSHPADKAVDVQKPSLFFGESHASDADGSEEAAEQLHSSDKYVALMQKRPIDVNHKLAALVHQSISHAHGVLVDEDDVQVTKPIKIKVSFENCVVKLVAPGDVAYSSLRERIDAKVSRAVDKSKQPETWRLAYMSNNDSVSSLAIYDDTTLSRAVGRWWQTVPYWDTAIDHTLDLVLVDAKALRISAKAPRPQDDELSHSRNIKNRRAGLAVSDNPAFRDKDVAAALSIALTRANDALVLENREKLEEAIDTYLEAAGWLQQACKSPEDDDKQAIAAIRNCYLDRATELEDVLRNSSLLKLWLSQVENASKTRATQSSPTESTDNTSSHGKQPESEYLNDVKWPAP